MRPLLIISNIFLALIIALLFFKGNFPEKIAYNLRSGEDYDYRQNYLYNVRVGQHMSYEGQADIVMLGDSMTEFAEWNELLGRNDVVNRGISGDITEGMLNRLETVMTVKPQMCLVMGGINDIIRGVPYDRVKGNIISIADILKQNNIKPVIQSVIYTGRNYEDKGRINVMVSRLNLDIEEFAEKNNIEYIDLNKSLCPEGFLKDAYTYDGLHLNAQGYKIWSLLLKEYLAPVF